MEKVNQFQLDVDMMDMDGETSMNQISTKSSEKATAQHHRKEVEGKKASTEVQMVATKKGTEEKTQEIKKLKAQQQSYAQTLGNKGVGFAALRTQMEKVQDVKHKEQESSGSKKSRQQS